MVLKMRALFRDLANLRERENLVTAAVGQDRPVPVHEAMQSAEMPNHFHSGPNEKVIGVSENDLRLSSRSSRGLTAFHAPLRPDRHESRRLDHAMRSR